MDTMMYNSCSGLIPLETKQGSDPNYLFDPKPLPRRTEGSSRRRLTRAKNIRSHAKRIAATANPQQTFAHLELSALSTPLPKDKLRPALEHDLRPSTDLQVLNSVSRRERNFQHNSHRASNVQTGRNAIEEGTDLALSSVPLPSDRNRLRAVRFQHPMPMSDDAQVAALYDMGLLYDSQDHTPSDSLTLNTIRHDEPLFAIRPAKKADLRKFSRVRRGTDKQSALNLDLSFADLGHDDAIAQYLMSPPASDTSSSADDAELQHTGGRRRSNQISAPLRVIYELDGSGPSFDVDTSQPPDLVLDSLSDYDCFSDSELDDDLPTQREVHDDEAGASYTASGEAWVILGDDS